MDLGLFNNFIIGKDYREIFLVHNFNNNFIVPSRCTNALELLRCYLKRSTELVSLYFLGIKNLTRGILRICLRHKANEVLTRGDLRHTENP